MAGLLKVLRAQQVREWVVGEVGGCVGRGRGVGLLDFTEILLGEVFGAAQSHDLHVCRAADLHTSHKVQIYPGRQRNADVAYP